MTLPHRLLLAVALLLTLLPPARADWSPPADKKISEQDFQTYLAAANDWADQNAKIDPSGIPAKDIDAQRTACIQHHNLTVPEFDWLAFSAKQAAHTASLEDSFAESEAQLQTRMKENQAATEKAKADMLAYQTAEKNGIRYLTGDDREQAIKDAQDDLKQAQDDVKQYMREAKAADDEANTHDQEADAATKLATYPPPGVSDADRAGYIEDKRKEAADDRDAAQDARKRENEAISAQADAQIKADQCTLRIAHPELPSSPDDKANVKAEDEAGIMLAQAEIDRCAADAEQISLLDTTLKKNGDAIAQDAPAENVAILRKYAAQYSQLMQKMTTTQPQK